MQGTPSTRFITSASNMLTLLTATSLPSCSLSTSVMHMAPLTTLILSTSKRDLSTSPSTMMIFQLHHQHGCIAKPCTANMPIQDNIIHGSALITLLLSEYNRWCGVVVAPPLLWFGVLGSSPPCATFLADEVSSLECDLGNNTPLFGICSSLPLCNSGVTVRCWLLIITLEG